MSSLKTDPDHAPLVFRKRYYLACRHEIAYLRFILESYDGLAFMRTLDKRSGLIEVAYPALRAADAEALLTALVEEAGLQQAPTPATVPPL